MSNSSQISKSAQYWTLLFGVVALSIVVGPLYEWLLTGIPQITPRQTTYYGLPAAIVIIGFFTAGSVLVFTSICNLRKLQ